MTEEKVAIGVLSTRVDNIEKKVDKLEDSTAILGRMELLLEQQTEMNKKQDIRLENMEQTFVQINTNLTALNVNQEKLKESIDNVNNRVDKIEVAVEENSEKDKISISEHLKKWITWMLFGLPTLLLGAYFLYKSGL